MKLEAFNTETTCGNRKLGDGVLIREISEHKWPMYRVDLFVTDQIHSSIAIVKACNEREDMITAIKELLALIDMRGTWHTHLQSGSVCDLLRGWYC